jgi:CDP-glycerol glycerophosphotransferase (TagB/SpsB family)
MCAPVIIYSHGEDDLDAALILLRGRTGLRIYLNHSQNHIKAGEYYTTHYASLTGLQKRLFEWRVTDFDYLLASSERERANFTLSYPHRANRILLGGGAHCDHFLQHRSEPPGRSIYYFPTFRDTAAGRASLDAVIGTIIRSERLRDWLRAEGLTLHIGAHINSDGQALKVDAPFVLFPVSRLKEGMFDCQAFISDYSGLLADFLPFDRPTIFFPFDRDDYLQFRRLYVPYDDFAHGPVVTSADELIDLLVSNRWRDPAPWAERRQFWRSEIFPTMEPVYAASTYRAIAALLAPRQVD